MTEDRKTGASGESTEARTAVITGASSGIGAAFARKLAAEGYDLILVARRAERLQEIADELSTSHGTRAEVHPADLTRPEDVLALAKRIETAESLELLVNSAGFGTTDQFPTCNIDRHMDMIQVHVAASVRLTRAALPVLMRRQRGGVINVSSVAAFLSGRGSATYCATKAYLNSFSKSLQADLTGTGVRVQALCPGFTYTGFHDTDALADFQRSRIPKMLWLSADYVVACSLKALRGRKVICIPSLRYRLITAVAKQELIGGMLKAIFANRIRK